LGIELFVVLYENDNGIEKSFMDEEDEMQAGYKGYSVSQPEKSYDSEFFLIRSSLIV